MRNEVLGRSEGSPGQKFNLQNTPILDRADGEHMIVRYDQGIEEAWTEVNDFANSSPTDKHYTLDPISGEVRFGPSMPQRDGSIRMYGAIPLKRALIMMKQYRNGGGTEGNMQIGAISELKTSIPYITRVANRQRAEGGLNAESVDDAKLRVPGYLRTLERAVTSEDFEYLAKKAAPGRVARAFALPVAADTSSRVNVFIIPHVGNPNGLINRNELTLQEDVQQMVLRYLDERRLLTTNLDILEPQYYWIRTEIRVRASKHYKPENVRQAIAERLTTYINPIVGGPNGNGWPFGRDLVQSDVIAALQDIPGIDFIRSIELYWIQYRADGTTTEEKKRSIETVQHGVVASERHNITVE